MDEILERIKRGIQYRDMPVLAADEQKNVTGYATTFNQPYVLYEDEDIRISEQIDARAFDRADMADIIMQYDHRGHVYARTRNNTLAVRTDDRGLFISANLQGTEIGRQLYEEIRGGYTDKMSFAFTVVGENMERTVDGSRRNYLRTITQIGKVFDVSAVSIPANGGTSISARNFCDGIIKEIHEESMKAAAEERMKQKLALRLRLMEV